MSSAQSIAPPPSRPIQAGLVSNPSTHAAAQVLEQLLHKDYVAHHCFFNDLGFHDHLSHHLVAAYDMGATPALLKLIYDDEVKEQRPIGRQGEDITEENWTSRLNDRTSYGSYLVFFMDQIAKNGTLETVRRYVMAPEANGNGAAMFARFLAGALHPFLQAGFGVELGQDYMVAQGLAMAAVTAPDFTMAVLDMPSALPELGPPTKGVTLLALLREVYDSPVLTPVLPYKPNATITARFKDVTADPARTDALKRIYSKWSVDASLTEAEFNAKIEECLFQATLLLAATGKPNRAPRLDFFLMHILTSALCLPSLLKALPDPVHKAQLLQGYARASALFIIMRGRPRINVPLLMSYNEHPRPPTPAPGGSAALGDPRVEGETDPWLAIVQNALHHRDARVIKTVRTLYYCAQRYGRTPAGAAIGARGSDGAETHVGTGAMDGTIFVRAAGLVSGALGWVAYGETEGDWDRSALGWDAAWEGQDGQ
ncbi:hypothetical protein B0H15DRAFT_917195 [Mycena belliarum]|uniref:Oxidoreductase AflY n=1 Tax=Mycena belliarum TaxID=1033014 RepID=A0AAD6TQH7_9AGAR|nr:hypothetical protein B0H15DRAFT_917195 [Mycena belliae]